MNAMITVRVNGEPRQVPEGLSMLALLRWLEINEKRVAVEWNRNILKPDRWDTEVVQAGDEIEVVHFVGGG
jgi:thiamine biosynthesis protein ThiS